MGREPEAGFRHGKRIPFSFWEKRVLARALFHPSGERALRRYGTNTYVGFPGRLLSGFLCGWPSGQNLGTLELLFVGCDILLAMQMNVVPTLPPRVPG